MKYRTSYTHILMILINEVQISLASELFDLILNSYNPVDKKIKYYSILTFIFNNSSK